MPHYALKEDIQMQDIYQMNIQIYLYVYLYLYTITVFAFTH